MGEIGAKKQEKSLRAIFLPNTLLLIFNEIMRKLIYPIIVNYMKKLCILCMNSKYLYAIFLLLMHFTSSMKILLLLIMESTVL